MRSLCTPAAVLLAVLTAFLLCCGAYAEAQSMEYAALPARCTALSAGVTLTQVAAVTAVRALRQATLARGLPSPCTRAMPRCAAERARLRLHTLRSQLRARYANSPTLAPPGAI